MGRLLLHCLYSGDPDIGLRFARIATLYQAYAQGALLDDKVLDVQPVATEQGEQELRFAIVEQPEAPDTVQA